MKKREVGPEHTAELFRGAKRVELQRPAGPMTTILSVRMPREVFHALSVVARQQEKGPATLAREFIERGLAQEPIESPTLAMRLLGRLLELVPEEWYPFDRPRVSWHHPLRMEWQQTQSLFAGRLIPPISTSPAGEMRKRPNS